MVTGFAYAKSFLVLFLVESDSCTFLSIGNANVTLSSSKRGYIPKWVIMLFKRKGD